MSTSNSPRRKRPRNPGQVDALGQYVIVDPYLKSLIHFNNPFAPIPFEDVASGTFWTAGGVASVNSAQLKFGDASGKFNSAGDYISRPDSNDWFLSNSDWTIDFWWRPISVTGTINILGQYQDTNNWWDIWVTAGTSLNFSHKDGGTVRTTFSATTSFVANTWYHVAVERFGNVAKMAVGGTFLTVTETVVISGKTLANLSAPLVIGLSNGSGNPLGWMDEFRFSNGVARWTSNFTPPTSEY